MSLEYLFSPRNPLTYHRPLYPIVEHFFSGNIYYFTIIYTKNIKRRACRKLFPSVTLKKITTIAYYGY